MFFAIVRTMLRTTECDDITQDEAVFSRRQVIGAQNAALLPTARNCSTQPQHATSACNMQHACCCGTQTPVTALPRGAGEF
jgi:hypothetical protein